MTDDWTKEIRERLDAATPGPWREEKTPGYPSEIYSDSESHKGYQIVSSEEESEYPYHKRGGVMDRNGPLIANCPTDIARLLEERDFLRENLMVMRGRSQGGDDVSRVPTRFLDMLLAWKPKEMREK